MGIPVATHKAEGPATCVTFLGILIDTQRFELRLPLDKVQRLRDLLRSWASRWACTRRELESLLGHLSHAASVIRPGRTFLRQLFGLLTVAKKPGQFVRLNLSARADIAWWQCFLDSWNGLSFFPLPAPSVHVFSDASSSFGCGAFVPTVGWFSLRWPDSWRCVDISTMELVLVILAAALWGKFWSGSHICFHSDNMGVIGVLKSGSARSAIQMHLLRCFAFFAAFFKFNYSTQHVPGVLNTAADALSRDELTLFFSLVPQTPRYTLPLPLLELIIDSQPDWGLTTWTSLFARSLAAVSPNLPWPPTSLGNDAI